MTDYVIDCNEKVIGRVGTSVAKMLLNGENVALINAEKAVMSGHKKDIYDKYKQLVEFKDKANPEHSPYWSRRPDLFVKRVIRGMLPYKKPKGKEAYKRLKVYMGVPEALAKAKIHKIEAKDPKKMYESVISIKELTQMLGYE